jgi:phosphate transport system permease protein
LDESLAGAEADIANAANSLEEAGALDAIAFTDRFHDGVLSPECGAGAVEPFIAEIEALTVSEDLATQKDALLAGLRGFANTSETLKAAYTTIQGIDGTVAARITDFHKARWETEKERFRFNREIHELESENERFVLRMRTVDGLEKDEVLSEIVRLVPVNSLGMGGKVGVYMGRWGEFLFDDPREANSEGGVMPAIFGTVVMTLFMTLVVVPFGVLAALYIREYAKAGPIISTIRIAINNLAGVPSIVFGVFGLGFFCYTVGGEWIDPIFYPEYDASNQPKYGTGGVLWASITLALLTLPVVIVATEEALAAVPKSMREGSYGCGASKWQTIRRIVLPRAMPGIMTGTILAMARGAGEVAPLMLVGAVKLAPDLPVDIHNWSGSFAFIPTGPIHLERSFMHLGFHIFDVGFQSQDSEAAKPMVYTTTALLIAIVTFLNIAAIWIRTQLRKKFAAGQF